MLYSMSKKQGLKLVMEVEIQRERERRGKEEGKGGREGEFVQTEQIREEQSQLP
jgi:hypothetical protein